jgi:hypothetical protein
MGMFVTYTQAFTVYETEVDNEILNLSEYTGSDDFLTVYTSQPLGKHKVLGTLEITNRLGVDAITHATIIPSDSEGLSIAADEGVDKYNYKIGSGEWIEVSYEDTSAIYSSVQVTVPSGSTETLYVIFEKTDLATSYYMSSIVVQEKES